MCCAARNWSDLRAAYEFNKSHAGMEFPIHSGSLQNTLTLRIGGIASRSNLRPPLKTSPAAASPNARGHSGSRFARPKTLNTAITPRPTQQLERHDVLCSPSRSSLPSQGTYLLALRELGRVARLRPSPRHTALQARYGHIGQGGCSAW